jgi:hypothetical protein
MPPDQKLTLGPLATIAREVVPSARVHRSQSFCHFLNAFSKSCFAMVLSTVQLPPNYEAGVVTTLLHWKHSHSAGSKRK